MVAAEVLGADAVQLASQTGRLDLISALLGLVAILLAFAAFPFTAYLRMRAQEIARETAIEAIREMENRIEAEAIQRLETQLPALVNSYLELARDAASAEVSDSIAAAQDDEQIQ